MRANKKYITSLIMLSFFFLMISVISAEDEITVKGRLIKIDNKQMRIVVKDSDDNEIEIVFDDAKVFSKIDKFNLLIGDKISVKYIIKDKVNIGKKIRSLKGC